MTDQNEEIPATKIPIRRGDFRHAYCFYDTKGHIDAICHNWSGSNFHSIEITVNSVVVGSGGNPNFHIERVDVVVKDPQGECDSCVELHFKGTIGRPNTGLIPLHHGPCNLDNKHTVYAIAFADDEADSMKEVKCACEYGPTPLPDVKQGNVIVGN